MSQRAEIPDSKIGKQWRFKQEEINTWMKNKKLSSIAKQQGKVVSSEGAR